MFFFSNHFLVSAEALKENLLRVFDSFNPDITVGTKMTSDKD